MPAPEAISLTEVYAYLTSHNLSETAKALQAELRHASTETSASPEVPSMPQPPSRGPKSRTTGTNPTASTSSPPLAAEAAPPVNDDDVTFLPPPLPTAALPHGAAADDDSGTADRPIRSASLPSGPSREWIVEMAPPADFADLEEADEEDAVVFFQPDNDEDEDDEEQQVARMRSFNLPVVYDPERNALEESVNFPIAVETLIAGRYRIRDYLGSGVFSRAVQCVALGTGRQVCIKIIRNNKDFLDQSLGEVKLLRFLNEHDPHDAHHVLHMHEFFYHKVTPHSPRRTHTRPLHAAPSPRRADHPPRVARP